MCFFPRILESLPPLLRQHSAAIGCTKNYQPIGMTVHSHSVESFEGLLQRCRREGGVAVNCGKTQFFLNTLYDPSRPSVGLSNGWLVGLWVCYHLLKRQEVTIPLLQVEHSFLLFVTSRTLFSFAPLLLFAQVTSLSFLTL